MAFEEVGIIYSSKGASEFIRTSKEAEISLRREQKAIDDRIITLKTEANAIKATTAPNRERLNAIRLEVEALRNSKSELRSRAQALRDEAKAAKESAISTKALDASTKGLSASVGSLLKVFAPLVALMSAGAILKTADEFNQLQGRVKNSLSDVSQFPKVFDELVASSNRSGQAIDGVAQAFARIRPAAEELGVSNEKLIRFNETFAKMGTLAGATSEEIKNSMIQLSQGLASGALRGDELRSVMEQMPQVARTIAESMGIPFKEFKAAAEDGKITAEAVFKAIINKSDEVDEAFSKLPGSLDRSVNRMVNVITILIGSINETIGVTKTLTKVIDDAAKSFMDGGDAAEGLRAILENLFGAANSLIGAFNGLMSLSGGLISFFEAVSVGARIAALGIDGLITSLQRLEVNRAAFFESFGPGNDERVKANRDKKLAQIDKDFADRNKDIAEYFDPSSKTYKMQSVLTGKSGTRKKLSFPSSSTAKKSKVKKGRKAGSGRDKTASIEAKRVEKILEDQNDFEKQLAINYDPANLGAFSTEIDKLNLKTEELNKSQAKLYETQDKLSKLEVKTTEGKEKKSKALKNLSIDLQQNALEIKKNQNAIAVYFKELNDRNQQFSEDVINDFAGGSLETLKSRIESIRDEWTDAYQRNQITAEQYYGKLSELSKFQTDAEIANVDRQIEAINRKIEAINAEVEANGKSLDVENGKLQSLEKQKQILEKSKDKIVEDERKAQEANNRNLNKDLRQYSDSLKDQTQQAIAEGISDVLKGNNILDSFKKFALKLRDIIINAFADALSRRLVKAFEGVFDWLGGALNKIASGGGGAATGQAAASAASGGSSALSGLLKKGAIGSVVGGLAGFTAGKVTGNRAIGAGTGLLAGAATGAIFGGPVGAIIGGLVGGVSGLFGGGSGKKAKEAKKRAQQEATANALAQKALAGVDQNNLLDLNARLSALLGNRKGLKGNAVRIVRDAAAQLQAMIEARKKAIEDAIKEIDSQNKDLVDSINLIGASAGDAFNINRASALRKLDEETKKLLDEFKDSEEAKTKILEQESLKRQLLLKQESETAKGTVEDLRDLLKQRDEAANANVFTRRKSNEQVKSETLKALDVQIAEQFQTLKATLDAGVTPLGTAGLNQILAKMAQITPVNANLQVIINEANDPAMVDEAVTRAFDEFLRKAYGANAA